MTLLAISGIAAGSASAAPGDLDPTFGTGGKAIINIGVTEGAVAVALQPDGKILATGTLGGDIATVRVTSQGDRDTTFGGAPGFSQLNFGNSDNASAVVAAADGSSWVTGTVTVNPGGGNQVRFMLTHLTPQGLLDTSFNPGGTPPGTLTSKYTSLGTSGSTDLGFALALQADGNVLVAGGSDVASPGTQSFAVSRVLNPDGGLDFGFGSAGGSFIDFQGGYDEATSIAVQPDGKIVLAGFSLGNGIAVARLLPGGALDPSFGSGGKTIIPDGLGDDLAIQPDGRIVVVGRANGEAIVARLNADGTPDNSFAGDGRTAVDFGGSDDFGSGVALQPDGKIVISGAMRTASAASMAAARLQPGGLLDTTFGDNGTVLVNSAGGDFTSDLVRQPDGKIVLAGFSGPFRDPVFPPQGDFALVRLQGDTGVKNAKCAGKKATIIGTNTKDKLKGTKKRDVIAALGGKDSVKGLAGNDLICGGKGKDRMFGGKGRDKLLGQAGKDSLFGGPGKDKAKGGAGKDVEKP